MAGTAAASATVPIGQAFLPEGVSSLWDRALPFFKVSGILMATYVANMMVKWGVERLAECLGLKPETRVAVSLAAQAVTMTSGVSLGLNAAGVSWAALSAFAGTALTVSSKDYIRNFIEGVKILLNRPFLMGDSIQIGDKQYKVMDMTLNEILLLREGHSQPTQMTYAQLVSRPITVFREYKNKSELSLGRPSIPFFEILKAAQEASRQHLMRATLWLSAGLGALFALPALKAYLAWNVFDGLYPFLRGGVLLWATWTFANWVCGLIARYAEKNSWDPQVAVILKLFLQAAIYVAGGSLALHSFGVASEVLVASLGVPAIVAGFLSADILGNLGKAIEILWRRPYMIGSLIEIAGVSGEVRDINMQWLLLEHSDKSHTLLPYSVVKASDFTILDPSADTSPPKLPSKSR
jgi:small-conductance mechanosensitive channel